MGVKVGQGQGDVPSRFKIPRKAPAVSAVKTLWLVGTGSSPTEPQGERGEWRVDDQAYGPTPSGVFRLSFFL